jgi:hypothetical protein
MMVTIKENAAEIHLQTTKPNLEVVNGEYNYQLYNNCLKDMAGQKVEVISGTEGKYVVRSPKDQRKTYVYSEYIEEEN